MKARHSRLSLFAACLLISAQAWATTFRLDTAGGEPLYQSPLPVEVYNYSRNNDLHDISILNAAGETVPYALLPSAPMRPLASMVRTVRLPVFTVQTKAPATADDLRLALKESNDTTTISITRKADDKDVRTLFLLDAGEKHDAIQKLTLDWAGSDGKLMEVELLASDDLNSWTNIGNATLLKITNTAGAVLQDSIVPNSPSKARYLQLRTVNEVEGFNLTSVEAQMASYSIVTPKLLWQKLQFIGRTQNNQHTNIEFEAAGHYPAESVRVGLPDDNTITTVKINVRNKVSESWRNLAEASIYRLVQQKKTLSNPDIVLPLTTARYWQLQFNTDSGGIGAASPTLSLGWPTQTIVWNARGSAPFTMQVGEAATTSSNRIRIETLIPDYKAEKIQQLPVTTIQFEAAQTAATSIPVNNTWSTPADNKRWWLWGGLLLGILVLAGMALSLLKSGTASSSDQS